MKNRCQHSRGDRCENAPTRIYRRNGPPHLTTFEHAVVCDDHKMDDGWTEVYPNDNEEYEAAA